MSTGHRKSRMATWLQAREQHLVRGIHACGRIGERPGET